ncbi:hypothetical protein DPMN_014870 [Dreissena polymorpha]|uniref:Uncharacterized protein n=1 Tax=Dreissena polymorpha TaxID=45954 RepID=A0A9D4N6S6_DREPO|nr:hypothetical protein DPMN_014870 [Dreissena polymorpha]
MARQRPTRIPTPHVCPTGAPGLVMGPCIVEIDRFVIRDVQYQFEEIIFRNLNAKCDGHTGGQTDGQCNHYMPSFFQGSMARMDGHTDGQAPEIITIYPRFSKSVGIIITQY